MRFTNKSPEGSIEFIIELNSFERNNIKADLEDNMDKIKKNCGNTDTDYFLEELLRILR